MLVCTCVVLYIHMMERRYDIETDRRDLMVLLRGIKRSSRTLRTETFWRCNGERKPRRETWRNATTRYTIPHTVNIDVSAWMTDINWLTAPKNVESQRTIQSTIDSSYCLTQGYNKNGYMRILPFWVSIYLLYDIRRSLQKTPTIRRSYFLQNCRLLSSTTTKRASKYFYLFDCEAAECWLQTNQPDFERNDTASNKKHRVTKSSETWNVCLKLNRRWSGWSGISSETFMASTFNAMYTLCVYACTSACMHDECMHAAWMTITLTR